MPGMTDLPAKRHERIRRQFARATAILEDAAAIAANGQGARVRRARLVAHARRLNADGRTIQRLSAAILESLEALDVDSRLKRPARRR